MEKAIDKEEFVPFVNERNTATGSLLTVLLIKIIINLFRNLIEI